MAGWVVAVVIPAGPFLAVIFHLFGTRHHGFAFTPRWSGAFALWLLVVITLTLDCVVRRCGRSVAATEVAKAANVTSLATKDAIAKASAARTQGKPAGNDRHSKEAGAIAISAANEQTTAAVRARRAGLKSLVVGADGRASTSKIQAVLWTYAVLFVLSYMVALGRKPYELRDTPVMHKFHEAFHGFIMQPLQPEYFALLGFPIAAAVAAKGITSGKVAAGVVTKPPGQAAGVAAGVAETVCNDQGQTDLVDFQYLAFNLFSLVYFFTAFITISATDPTQGFPAIPTTLLALAGVSTTGYLFKKQLETGLAPIVTSVTPMRIVLGADAQMLITGSGFIDPAKPPVPTPANQVLLDGRPLPAQDWTPTSVTVTLPAGADRAALAAQGWRAHEANDPAPLIVRDDTGKSSTPVDIEVELPS